MLLLLTASLGAPGRPGGVHALRAAQIAAINSNASVHWRAAAQPRFASLAPGASANSNGVRGDWAADIREAIAKGEIEPFDGDANAEIPDEFDSETNWPACAKIIGDIRDQSNCGCCWAFAGAEAASDRMCIATGGKMMTPLSAQDVCFCASLFGCQGGMIRTPWTHILHAGAVTGGQYKGTGPFGPGMCADYSLPHCHHHGPQGDDPFPPEGAAGCPSEASPRCPRTCDADAGASHADWAADKISFIGAIQSASGEAAIQQMIMAGGPVETAFTVYSDFEDYAGGIYHHVKGSSAGGHAVKFVGWGVDNGIKYWKVANSWNPHWGEAGYFRIVRGVNEGGIESQVIAAAAEAKWGRKQGLDAMRASAMPEGASA